ncbi:Hypothetical_protein [Hexamita inflata]|uniref:Hypothetical_protein n=1 Tax=Hexamita inflata TaxID=28002 RepID=A0AA86U9J2_9EUKA|nr:Hypothetical protein HINF_LOCUS36450 [Hexamita inflata]CAI9963413.1 Hypothetical protein HINF_LOCUS51058 [Hexamita inflata]
MHIFIIQPVLKQITFPESVHIQQNNAASAQNDNALQQVRLRRTYLHQYCEIDNCFRNQQHTDAQYIRTNNNQQSQRINYKLLLTSNPLNPLQNQQCRRNELQIQKRRQLSIIQIRKVFKHHGVFNSINSHEQECVILQITSMLLLSIHLNYI